MFGKFLIIHLMKHLFLLIITTLLLGSCGSKSTKQSKETTEKAQAEQQLAGGYSAWDEITPQELGIFMETAKEHSKNYKPHKVSRQVVNGVNLRYMCHHLGKEDPHIAFITIFVPLESDKEKSKPEVVEVKRMQSFGRQIRKQ